MKNTLQKWAFTSRLRARAFAWKSSPLACQRVKEAVSEIQTVARQDSLRAAEGAIQFMERLAPALEQVDSSSGALGNATNRAVSTLIELVIAAPADAKTREVWLDRLWQAFQDDGGTYLYEVGDRWGEVCGSAAVAGLQADSLVSILRHCWNERAVGVYSYFVGTIACFSCLLAAGRHQELLDLLELAPHVAWSNRRYGAQALAAMGQTDEAIAYALASRGLNDGQSAIDRLCEEILLSQGRQAEAYQRFGLSANWATTYLATFRAVKKKYPQQEPLIILQDLIAHTPGNEGKWFATAKDLGLFDLALELASHSPTDPKTLNRAARDFQTKHPHFALGAALASLHWIVDGYGYEITTADFSEACGAALRISQLLGTEETVRKEIEELLQTNSAWTEQGKRLLWWKAGE